MRIVVPFAVVMCACAVRGYKTPGQRRARVP